MTGAWRDTALTRALGIELPIALGAFGGLSSVPLTAAVSNAGGLGSFGLYGYDAERIRSTARALREQTGRPFALNLWLPHGDQIPPVDDDDFRAWVAPLEPFFVELGLALPTRPQRYLPDFDEQFDALLDARPAVASFVFGVPSEQQIDRLHSAGTSVLGTATTVAEGRALAAAGVDAVIASGFEAGGHRVSFLAEPEDSLIGLFALLPQLVDAVDVPVVATGGIADARGVAAALTLGASAAQLGTAFLVCAESAISDAHRSRILGADAESTVLTRAFSGRLARGIPNRMLRELESTGTPLAPFPVQNWLTAPVKAEAARRGDSELMSLWAGQAAALVRRRGAAELVDALARGTDALVP
ncbi:nitronate monooxygenase [Microterricola gilva]|uniref:Probable nitronate monooxygenase n=1 Tax=Microterricola gilva TaxID=393267 RepID=A0A4Q8AMJ0_9MICO|nr:nitronate monooxygenase [Microterricola gilva]RZU65155.1 nitronate monooxygenase [Microterricola gilva]